MSCSSTVNEIRRLYGEGRIQYTDGINTEMNRRRADHIRKFPTAVPRDGGTTGVRPETIPTTIEDRGEKERGIGSHSGVTVDRN